MIARVIWKVFLHNTTQTERHLFVMKMTIRELWKGLFYLILYLSCDIFHQRQISVLAKNDINLHSILRRWQNRHYRRKSPLKVLRTIVRHDHECRLTVSWVVHYFTLFDSNCWGMQACLYKELGSRSNLLGWFLFADQLRVKHTSSNIPLERLLHRLHEHYSTFQIPRMNRRG